MVKPVFKCVIAAAFTNFWCYLGKPDGGFYSFYLTKERPQVAALVRTDEAARGILALELVVGRLECWR